MGVRRLLYLGPYAECVRGKPETTERKVQGCTNAKCKKRPRNQNYTRDGYYPRDVEGTQSGKFCSACGGKIGEVVIQET